MRYIETAIDKVQKFFTKSGGNYYLREGDADRYRNKNAKQSIWFNWRNSIERPGKNVYGLWPLGFSAWLHFGTNNCISMEWRLDHKHARLGICVDSDEGDIVLATACPPVWLSFSITPPYKWFRKLRGRRDTSIRYHDGSLWVNIWQDDMEWHANRKWWQQRYWSINLVNLVLGKTAYSTRDIEKRDVLIPMPEGSYEASALLFESTWSRPRWPFKHRLMRATLDIKKDISIPYPGKGENSWDCGMDGLRGTTAPARTIEEAIGNAVASVMRNRTRRGGKGWLPNRKEIPPSVRAVVVRNDADHNDR